MIGAVQRALEDSLAENNEFIKRLEYKSLEKQVLDQELNDTREKLLSVEKELRESKQNATLNSVIQDQLDPYALKVDKLQPDELDRAKDVILAMEIEFNCQMVTILEEKNELQLELDAQKEDCEKLTGDVLNFQAEKDCQNAFNIMNDARTKLQNKAHLKKVVNLQENELNNSTRLLAFITDFDTTVPATAKSEDIIELFLSGRGLAINKKRRKHFAALKENNIKLYDEIDTLNELIEVEVTLHGTRIELYTKSVKEGSTTSTPCGSIASTPRYRGSIASVGSIASSKNCYSAPVPPLSQSSIDLSVLTMNDKKDNFFLKSKRNKDKKEKKENNLIRVEGDKNNGDIEKDTVEKNINKENNCENLMAYSYASNIKG